MRTPLLAVAAATAVLLSACTGGVEHVSGAAAPAVQPPSSAATPAPVETTTTAPAATTAPARTKTKPPSNSNPQVLGSLGLGALKLGQTRAQATATGLITDWFEVPSDQCPYRAHLKNGPAEPDGMISQVFWNKDGGVSAIAVYGTIHTPDGIRIGSRRSDVLLAYNEWSNISDLSSRTGIGIVGGSQGLEGNKGAEYRIDISRTEKVQSLTLQSKKYGCYE
ncbi:hypothetical protein KOI35_46575 [Actinoplanes bogorensis]|uniref:Uncharacterized protein n=1 Tax=Paractinoplanes bogorensis TaxID=1610840 RepID=A0ABS5Z5L7_9ACTN|nr:hypothetical protein [Actinoplanes bogorensis]MBU2670989.1 hypothetical protein [Actinoplanes bogorensis]